jgi:hypothetical protein
MSFQINGGRIERIFSANIYAKLDIFSDREYQAILHSWFQQLLQVKYIQTLNNQAKLPNSTDYLELISIARSRQ